MTTPRRTDPYRAFNFIVKVEGKPIAGFSEVSGLHDELVAVDHRGATERASPARKPPALHKAGNITLKRGVVNDKAFQQWQAAGAGARRRATIVVYDAAHRPLRRWQIVNAWISKFTGPSLAAAGNEVAIESLELTHEGVTTDA